MVSLFPKASYKMSSPGVGANTHAVTAWSQDGNHTLCQVYQNDSTDVYVRVMEAQFRDGAPYAWTSKLDQAIGTKNTGSFHGNNNYCKRGSVCGLQDGSFAVTFCRYKGSGNAQQSNSARVEYVRVYRGTDGWTVDTEEAGEGYTIDDTVTRGDGDVMPQISWIKQDMVFLSWVHESQYDTSPTPPSPNTRTYTIRRGIYECGTAGSGNATLKDGVFGLSNIDIDDLDDFNWASTAGLVLPHIAVDRNFNLLTAYEQADGSITTIEVRRDYGPGSSSPISTMDDTFISTGASGIPNRRPRISTLHPVSWPDEAENVAWVTWGIQQSDTTTNTWKASKLTLDEGAASESAITVPANTNISGTQQGISRSYIVALPGEKCLAVAVYTNEGGEGKRLVGVDETNAEIKLTNPWVGQPTRPHLTISRLADSSDFLLALTYEGEDQSGDQTNTYTDIYRGTV